MKTYKDIDGYIKAFPKDVQLILKKLRSTIHKAAPHAKESITYGIPTYKLGGNLVHFGAFKDHISFFPTSSGVTAFKKELKDYNISRGTIRFPLDIGLPFTLIAKIVKFRVKEIMKEAE